MHQVSPDKQFVRLKPVQFEVALLKVLLHLSAHVRLSMS